MEDTSIFATVLLPMALALIMGTLGLSLTPADFKRIFVRPRGVMIGLGNLVLLSPLLAFAVAELYGLEAALAVGLVLLGASPGGTLANLLTHLARGDTALSITMTACSSVAAVVTVPLFLGLAIDHFGASVADDISMPGVVARVFAITIVPLSIGMWLRRRNPARAIAAEPKAKRIAAIVFGGVVIGAIVDQFETGHGQLRGARTCHTHVERSRDGRLLHDCTAGAPRRAPVNGDRDGTRDPQRGAGDRRRDVGRGRSRHSGRGLQLADVFHGRCIRPRDVPAQRRGGGAA